MGDWQTLGIGRIDGVRGTNPTTGNLVTASGSTNTKGAYATIDYAPFDVSGVMLLLNQNSQIDFLVDVALGAAGSESIVVNDLLHSCGANVSRSRCYYLPLAVKSGTRLSMRCQCPTGSATFRANITWMQESWGGQPSFEKFHTYGASLSNTFGVALANPGATAWGAWTQIIDATAFDHEWILPLVGEHTISSRTAGNIFSMQAGVGAAGSEVPLTPTIWMSCGSTAVTINHLPGWWTPVARGQRLAMRYGCNAATALGLDGVIIAGVR